MRTVDVCTVYVCTVYVYLIHVHLVYVYRRCVYRVFIIWGLPPPLLLGVYSGRLLMRPVSLLWSHRESYCSPGRPGWKQFPNAFC